MFFPLIFHDLFNSCFFVARKAKSLISLLAAGGTSASCKECFFFNHYCILLLLALLLLLCITILFLAFLNCLLELFFFSVGNRANSRTSGLCS